MGGKQRKPQAQGEHANPSACSTVQIRRRKVCAASQPWLSGDGLFDVMVNSVVQNELIQLHCKGKYKNMRYIGRRNKRLEVIKQTDARQSDRVLVQNAFCHKNCYSSLQC